MRNSTSQPQHHRTQPMMLNKTHAITGSLALIAAAVFMTLNLGRWLSAPAGQPMQADVIVALGGDEGERVKTALSLYQAGYAKYILLTGVEPAYDNSRSNYTNDWRTRYLLKQGVPEEALLFDNQARNTWQEGVNTAQLLKNNAWNSALVVSDPPHMRRLKQYWQPIFDKQALQLHLIQTRSPDWNPQRWWQNEKWAQFCVKELTKLIYYTYKYSS